MSKRIKGITIEINGDTTGLDKSLAGVEKQARKTQGELNDINKLLRLDPNNTELVAQKMQALGEAVNNTQNKLSALRQAQQQVEQQFANGEIGADQYRAFMREIADTEASLASYKNQLQSVQAEQANLGKATQQMQRFFDATGKGIDDFADVLGTDLVNAIKQGRATSAQLESAFDQMGQSALGANVDLERLRTSLRTMDSGGSLDSVRQDLQEIERDANAAEQSVDKLSSSLGAMGGVIAGVGLGEIVEKSLSSAELQTKIDVTFNVPEESKATIRDTLGQVKALGVDGEEALEGLRRQWALNSDASDEFNQKIALGAASVSKAYSGLDFTELVQELNEISGELKISDDEALELVNSLMRVGFPPEQLDIVAEYGSQLKRAGFEAEEIKNIMASAVAVDSFNIDMLLDGLKEGRIKAAEMGRGLSEGFKSALGELLNDVKGASDEQLATMQEGFSKQEAALSKSISNRERDLSKSQDKQKQALDKALNAEYDAMQKSYSKAEDAKSKTLEKQYDVVVKTYDKQKDELEKALDAELRAFEKASNEKIAIIDKEYTEKLKLIDEDRYNQIKAIESEIDGINAAQEAEDKRQQDKDNADKRAELKEKVRTAKDSKSKQEAAQALRDFEEKLRLDKTKESRKAQIDELKTQKDSINEAFSEQKDALKLELDEKKQQAKEVADTEKEALKERQDAEKKTLQENNAEKLRLLKENQTAELNLFKETNAQKLEQVKEEHTARKESLSERLSIEADAVKEAHQAELASFKAMNAEKLDLAKNPPDSAAYTGMVKQLETWGKAVAASGEEGTKAFIEMAEWLETIDDKTLKNAIATELYGTKYEDMGDSLINTLKGTTKAAERLKEAHQGIDEQLEKQQDDPYANLRASLDKVSQALKPLFDAIAKVVSAIADVMAKFPGLTALIGGIVTAAGLLSGAIMFLTPLISAIPGIIAAIGPVITAITGAFATLSGVVLPALGAAFGAISAPVLAVIAAIAAIIAIVVLLVKKWEPIKKFFSDLWKAVADTFKSAGKWLGDAAGKISEMVMKPINKMRDSIINAFNFVKTKLSEIWGGIVNVIKKPLNMLIEMLNGFITGMNGISVPDWVPVIGSKGINIPEIPMLAKGTDYFRGGPAIVGEKGPELVEMPTGAKVHNASKTADMLGGTQQEIVVPVTLTLDGKVLAQHTAKFTSREMYNQAKAKKRGWGDR